MNETQASLAGPGNEISRLLRQFHETAQALETLTGGKIKAVLVEDGPATVSKPPGLEPPPHQIRQPSVAAQEPRILNLLAIEVAILDREGTIVSVNDVWKDFARQNGLASLTFGVGQNYLQICDQAVGVQAGEGRAAAAGLRSVLSGSARQFSIEYPCESAQEKRWFRLKADAIEPAGPGGAVVIHIDVTDRKLAENLHRDTEERFRHVFAAAAVGMAMATPEGRFLQANAAFCTMFGYTEAELQQQDFASLIHPADRPAPWQAAHHPAGWPGEHFRTEIRCLRKSGAIIWVRPSASRTFSDPGGPRRMILVAEDVTELKLTESRFRRIVNSNGQAMFFWNAQGQVTDGNNAFLSLTGYSRADLEAGRVSWSAMTPPEFAELDQRALTEVANRGSCALYEKEWIRKDGRRVPILISGALMENSEDEGVSFVVDLTERLKTEAALRLSEKRFKALFEQAAVGVALTDVSSGRFLQVNQRYCEITGWTPEELGRLTIADILQAGFILREQEMVQQLKTGQAREFSTEKCYRRKDGTEIWVHATVGAMWAPGEPPDYVMRVAQDITSRKQLENSLRQAQKLEALGTLAGGIAHDFNNILTSINGYTELARLELKENSEVREHLDAVLHAGRRAAVLVRQILAFSRQQPLARLPVQLEPVMVECLKLMRGAIPATVEFVTSFAPDAPLVLADSSQIHQVLMNLGTNAWQALADSQGRVEFRLDRFVVDASLAATESRLRPGLYARISVSDTGCGMDAITQGRIFDPYFTTKPPGQGTGLGLAVVHGIMETHDGAITVCSQPGLGTIFQLYFPALTNAQVVPQVAPAPAPRGRGERILLVDDDEPLVQFAQKTLASLGYEVEAATKPRMALEMVRADPARFALVITDQTMPEMTGLVLASQLREIRAGLPVILTTGFSPAVTADSVQQAGIRQLLMKPISIYTLGTAIQEVLASQTHPQPGEN